MKRKPKVVKENSERWLLTYADLITLLMIFFILLYAMSSTDARKFQDLTGALQQAFNNGTYQLVTIGGSPGNPHTLSGTTPSQKAIVKKLQEQVHKFLKMIGMPQTTVTVGESHEGIVVSLAGNLLFYPGGSELKPQSTILIRQVAQVMAHLPNAIRVEGNTDSSTPGGSSSANWSLSASRAVSVVRYLSEEGGIAPTRLQAVANGEYHPVAPNTTAAGRARNRHADIVILYH